MIWIIDNGDILKYKDVLPYLYNLNNYPNYNTFQINDNIVFNKWKLNKTTTTVSKNTDSNFEIISPINIFENINKLDLKFTTVINHQFINNDLIIDIDKINYISDILLSFNIYEKYSDDTNWKLIKNIPMNESTQTTTFVKKYYNGKKNFIEQELFYKVIKYNGENKLTWNFYNNYAKINGYRLPDENEINYILEKLPENNDYYFPYNKENNWFLISEKNEKSK